MSQTEGAGDSARRGAEQQAAAKTQTEREARDFAEETGYKPSVNQRRHEPLPASRHDERRQEAVVRNEEHASDRPQAAPSPTGSQPPRWLARCQHGQGAAQRQRRQRK